MRATYAPTDISRLTREVASAFRSAVEKCGLRLAVECAPLSEPVYADDDMWEKIVLNLVSNAFKFTFEGEIIVRLRETETHYVRAAWRPGDEVCGKRRIGLDLLNAMRIAALATVADESRTMLINGLAQSRTIG